MGMEINESVGKDGRLGYEEGEREEGKRGRGEGKEERCEV